MKDRLSEIREHTKQGKWTGTMDTVKYLLSELDRSQQALSIAKGALEEAGSTFARLHRTAQSPDSSLRFFEGLFSEAGSNVLKALARIKERG